MYLETRKKKILAFYPEASLDTLHHYFGIIQKCCVTLGKPEEAVKASKTPFSVLVSDHVFKSILDEMCLKEGEKYYHERLRILEDSYILILDYLEFKNILAGIKEIHERELEVFLRIYNDKYKEYQDICQVYVGLYE